MVLVGFSAGCKVCVTTVRALIQKPSTVGARFPTFCRFSWFLIVFVGLPAGLFTLPALF